MTQIGKCDTCRTRKVKCDEKKPKCGACSKKNRPCTYSYGKASALVREDPNQFSGHGKSKSTPMVVPLVTSYVDSEGSSKLPSPLRLTMEKESEDGHGMFQTFTFVPDEEKDSKETNQLVRIKKSSTPSTMFSRSHTPESWHTIPLPPSSPMDTLAKRCIRMFGPLTWDLDSLSIHGSWIESIPARLGSSEVLDSAVDYAVSGYATYADKSYSAKHMALKSRSRALESLRSAITEASSKKIPSYDLLLATKLHAFTEIFVAVGSLAYTYHSLGLSQLLKAGNASGIDPEHYWSLVDNTYYDEVNVATMIGRPSWFDTPLYLELTHPDKLNESKLQEPLDAPLASTLLMHVFIQIPRLICLVRSARTSPDDTESLFSAITLAISLWEIAPTDLIDSMVSTSTTTIHKSPSEIVADVIPSKLIFDSVQALIICTKFWSFQMFLCGLIQALWDYFPAECASMSLIDLELVRQTDIRAGILTAQSLSASLFYSATLPLVPLRVLGPLSQSTGPWYRLYCRMLSALTLVEPGTPESIRLNIEMEKARRLENWVIDECNNLQDAWNVKKTERDIVENVLECMSGSDIPEWVKTIKFVS